MHSKKLSLKQMVEHLGPFLTSEREDVRARATLALAEVLTRLPDFALNEQSVQTLVTFFCERLKDYGSSREVLKGLWAIVKSRPLPAGVPTQICNGFLDLLLCTASIALLAASSTI